jgi:phage regulator Rha-like protein
MPFTHTQSVNPKLVLNQIHTYHRSKDLSKIINLDVISHYPYLNESYRKDKLACSKQEHFLIVVSV